MAKTWVQSADGRLVRCEASDVRAGTAEDGNALGCVPIVGDTFVPGQTVNADADMVINASDATFAECVPNDAVVVNPTVTDPFQTPNNALLGLTIGPCCVSSTGGALTIVLQNRTAAPIVIPVEGFFLRVTVLHILPATPEAP